ncbi:hypothetical protein AVEN_121702-1 [Araneus ventricosus]|uniref:Uncharacterized protein n=1 Tax=Araneus ventricosus TaxID=182803 RepID=A0A4Y2E9W9_ARAVE|nr:hypothetical protein AVEN_121702-1 [Araneus ventricosus]
MFISFSSLKEKRNYRGLPVAGEAIRNVKGELIETVKKRSARLSNYAQRGDKTGRNKKRQRNSHYQTCCKVAERKPRRNRRTKEIDDWQLWHNVARRRKQETEEQKK